MNSRPRISNFESRIFKIKRPRLLRLISLCWIGCVSILLAQSSTTQSGSPFILRVDVDLVTIEVHVLDGKGNPVPNLKKEQFRLYEDGKKQEIVSFDEVNSKSVPLPSTLPIIDSGDRPHGKTVLLIFDVNTIPLEQFEEIRNSAMRFVQENMRPQDLFAVALRSGTMRIIQNLTDDRESILAAITQVSPRDASYMDFQVLLQALEQINYSIASIKGQKSVLIFGRPITFYGSYMSESYSRALNSAKKSNVIYYMINTGSTPTIALESPNLPVEMNESERELAANDSARRKALLPSENTFISLAAATGGFSITDARSLDSELDKLDQQLSSYYILGFQSSDQKHDGAFRRVRVTTSAKGTKLRYPPGYQDRRPIDVLANSKQEKMLLTSLATPGASTQLPIIFRPAYFYDASKLARIVIAAKIRTTKLAFRKKEEQVGIDLAIMGAAYAENGSIAARFSEAFPIRFDKEKELEFRKQDLVYRNYFKLRPGKYRLKLAVSDESNHLGAAEQLLEVPALPDQALACSSLVVAEQLSSLPGLVQKLRTQLLDYSDPLIYQGNQIRPSIENKLPVNSAIPVLFRAYNLRERAEEWDLLASPKLLGQKGEVFVLPPFNLKEAISPVGPTEAAIALRMPFRNVPPGKYLLVLEVKANNASQTATLQTDLEFVDQRR